MQTAPLGQLLLREIEGVALVTDRHAECDFEGFDLGGWHANKDYWMMPIRLQSMSDNRITTA